MSNYSRPAITQGNDFTIRIAIQQFLNGEYVDFNINTVKSFEVYLTCSAHNQKIPLKWEIEPGFDNIISCFVDYYLVHAGASYGIGVEGVDENDKHFRWYMAPREGILVINNTSGQNIPQDVEVVDYSARVGWGIKVDADLTNYYTKSEVDDLIAEIEVEIGDTYTKEEISQLLTLYPTKEEINTKFNDYYTKTQTDNLLNQKVDKSELATVATTGDYNDLSNKPDLSVYAAKTDLNDYYDKTQTDTLLNQKADTSDLNSYQELLVSGQNIKTINNESLLGSGNIEIQGGGGEQVQADWDETDTTDPAYIQNKPDLDDMQVVIGNALLDNDAKIANVQYNVIPEVRQSLNQRIDETNAAIQNTQSSVNDELDALDDQLYTAAQALNDLKESMPEGGVTSFNGATGAVTYEAPVTSVNGMTGAVTIQTGGGGVESFNGMTGAVTYEAPVTSVNGMTGAVTISIPTNTSDLTNDSGFLTSAPVSSVNGQTGAVTIDTGVTSFNGMTGAVTYEAPVTSVNGMTGAVTIQTGGGVESFNGMTGAVTYAAPVSSVNGQTGAVTISTPDPYIDDTNPMYQYFTITALTTGSLTCQARSGLSLTLQYRQSNSDQWLNWSITSWATSTMQLFKGVKYYFKGTKVGLSTSVYNTQFGGTAQIELSGNLLSLLYGDEFIQNINGSLNDGTGALRKIFSGHTGIISAKNLVIPIDVFQNRVFEQMFLNCTNLEYGPQLLFTNEDSYTDSCKGMFSGCTSLKYLKCTLVTDTAPTAFSNWLQNVAPTGIFVKADNMTQWTLDSASGIPTGWAVLNESDLEPSLKYETVTSSTNGLKIEVVSALPSSRDANTIYIVQ